MANKLTILVDGGWLNVSRAFIHEKGFKASNTDFQKQAASEAFKETLAQSYVKFLNLFPQADNIVLMSEGGSWRKHMPVPDQLKNITYKGNRERKSETDWNAIFGAYGEFAKNVTNAGGTVSQHWAIEGDDWAWYWSRRLNEEGSNVIILTSDCDLKQLVQIHNNSFTAWYNDKAGLVLPQECAWKEDPIEAMLNPPYQSIVLNELLKKYKNVSYINPDQIVINKVLCGDAGDNIMSVIRYQKGSRTYKFSEKDYQKIIAELDLVTIEDLKNNYQNIANWIVSQEKFVPYGFNKKDIIEMLEYNLSLVWLHETVMPDTVTNAMVQVEYNQAPINDFKSNYKILLEQKSDIGDIFEGAQ